MQRRSWAMGIATCVLAFSVLSAGVSADGALNVKVNWEGKPYRGKRMKQMNKECTGFHGSGKPPRSAKVVTNENGTLQNVFVYVKNAPKGDYAKPSEPALLDQVGCVYIPRVQGVMAGQVLEVKNSDPTAHNVHFTPKKNKEINKSQPKINLVEKLVFKRAEQMVPVKCDVHPWMVAFVGVMDHPFFGTTREEGTIAIHDLPGGTYKIVTWHEKYGEKEMEVTVSTGESKDIEFTYSRKDK
jgi:plastocyanin